MAQQIEEKILDINDQPTAAELTAYKGDLLQGSSEAILNDYLRDSVQLANDQQSNAIALIGGLQGITTYLGSVKAEAYKKAIMDIAAKAINFAEGSVEFAFLDIEGSNEGTSKSIQGKMFEFTNELITPNIRSRLNSIGIYNFVYKNIVPFNAESNYVPFSELKASNVTLEGFGNFYYQGQTYSITNEQQAWDFIKSFVEQDGFIDQQQLDEATTFVGGEKVKEVDLSIFVDYATFDDVLLDYAKQDAFETLVKAVKLLFESDGTLIEVAIEGSFDNDRVNNNGDTGISIIPNNSYDDAANIKFQEKFPLNGTNFDIKKLADTPNEPTRDYLFSFAWTAEGKVGAKDEWTFIFKLVDDNGAILDSSGNPIQMTKYGRQSLGDSTEEVSKQFTMNNIDYTNVRWENHYDIDGTAFSHAEPMINLKTSIAVIDIIGQSYTSASFLNDAKTLEIDTLDGKTIVDSINENKDGVGSFYNYYESQRIQSTQEPVPETLVGIPGTTKVGASGAEFAFDPFGGGSNYSNGDSINNYVGFGRLQTRGNTGDLTPYLQKDFDLLQTEINDGVATGTLLKFNELSQKIIPFMYNLYKVEDTHVAKIDANFDVTKVAIADVSDDYNVGFGSIFTIEGSEEDQLLQFKLAGQDGLTYAQKLALANQNIQAHGSVTELLHLLVDVNTGEVLGSYKQPFKEWQNPDNFFISGNSESNGALLPLSSANSILNAGKEVTIFTLSNGINLHIKTGSFEGTLFGKSIDTTITGLDSDNKPVIRKSTGEAIPTNNIMLKQVNGTEYYRVFEEDSAGVPAWNIYDVTTSNVIANIYYETTTEKWVINQMETTGAIINSPIATEKYVQDHSGGGGDCPDKVDKTFTGTDVTSTIGYLATGYISLATGGSTYNFYNDRIGTPLNYQPQSNGDLVTKEYSDTKLPHTYDSGGYTTTLYYADEGVFNIDMGVGNKYEFRATNIETFADYSPNTSYSLVNRKWVEDNATGANSDIFKDFGGGTFGLVDISDGTTRLFWNETSFEMYGALDMKTNRIGNLNDAVTPDQAVNKGQLDGGDTTTITCTRDDETTWTPNETLLNFRWIQVLDANGVGLHMYKPATLTLGSIKIDLTAGTTNNANGIMSADGLTITTSNGSVSSINIMGIDRIN